MSDDLEVTIKAVFRDVLKRDVPSAQTDLLESGLLDSLALVELLFELEKQLGITLELETLEVDTFRTLDTIAGYVERQQLVT
jgi:acyl carrier protein